MTDVNFLPDDAPVSGDDEGFLDVSDLRVNFSDQEASSEARDFSPVPSGKYHVAITDVNVERCGPNSKNPGKPYYRIEMTCQSGPYEGRKFWGNIMLFNGALYSLSQLCKAIGKEEYIKQGKVPSADELQGEQIVINVKKQLDTYAMERDGGDEKQFKNEVKGYMPLGTGQNKTGGGESSLMP